MFDCMTRVQYAGLSIDAFVEMCRSHMCGVCVCVEMCRSHVRVVCVCMRKKKRSAAAAADHHHIQLLKKTRSYFKRAT